MRVDIETFSDADYVQTFSYVTAIAEDPISLAGETLRMVCRVNAGDPTALFECTEENLRLVRDTVDTHKFTLTIPLAILSTLTPGEYVHSLIRTNTVSGLKRPIWRGSLVHAAGPTR